MTEYENQESGTFFPEESRQEEPRLVGVPQKQPSALAKTIFEYTELIVITMCILLFATLFLVRHTVVDGDSMRETLQDGEHLIITDLFYTPKVGDIVVFESAEETGLDEPLIKRVIATEGQTVLIDAAGVWVDGALVEAGEQYLTYNHGLYFNRERYNKAILEPERSTMGVCYRYEVGEGQVFVMGDNRFNSLDSRVFGAVSEDCILGHVILRLLPLGKFGGVD